MSENKNNMDPLEQFFQKKTSEYDIAYREEDWLRLEKNLDLREAQISYQRKIRWVAAAAVLALSLLGYFTFENYVRLNELQQLMSDDISSPASPVHTPEVDSPGPGAPLEQSHDDAASPRADDRIGDETFLSDLEEHTQAPEELPYRDRAEEQTAEILPADPSRYSKIPPVPRIPDRVVPGFEDRSELPALAGREHKKAPVFVMDSPESVTSGYSYPATRANVSGHSTLQAMHHGHGIDHPESPVRSRLSVGFVMAPDLSMTSRSSGFQNPGYKFGVTVEYKLNSRLSVATGIVPSVVRYSADGWNYQQTAYDSGSNREAEVVGECLLLDIPVSLAYKMFDFSKSSVFISAGLSSYIMVNEEYNFSYEGEVGDDLERWSDRTGTRHWFSNAGLSIGYEREITRNISLRAEPYVRLPVREVGWANVRLYSMGTFFSLQYNL